MTADDRTPDDVPFETVSSSEVTRGERIRATIDEWILVPARILWSDWRARVGTLIMLLYVLMGTVGVWLVDAPQIGEGERLIPPFTDPSYPLGTDSMGNDLFAQVVHATPPMLEMIVAGALFTTVMATIVGTFSGYKGGRTDKLLMMFTDILLTIPGLPLVIVIAVILEPREPWVIGIILTLNAWAGLARAIRSQVLTMREESFVEASRLMGLPTRTILVKDIVPGLMPYILVNFVNSARTVVFTSVGLYFLGILPFTNHNWGVMMNLAYTTGGALYTLRAAHWLLVPMAAIVLLSFGFILFAQGTDRLFNPRVRARHENNAGANSSDDADENSGKVSTHIQG
ncbi:ABC transporter permease [Natrarchaeobius chitinivorans]|uniref:ABC transporter permease n=1 Tax=Natrarchaeobius chitinivorans TaxID=1679083 RepID=A0A3N6PC42_NATCH|nr:ABC transporter permease [Natrarchaeobius chitinivorans]RQG94255.1 ABC transporter permease [Natrarchaeobius chitinivorans]